MMKQEEAFLHDAARHLRDARVLLQAGQNAGAISSAIRSLQRTFYALLIAEGISITFDPHKRFFTDEVQPRFAGSLRQCEVLFSDAFREQVTFAESLWPRTVGEQNSMENPEGPYCEEGHWVCPNVVLSKSEALQIVQTADQSLRIVHECSPKLQHIPLHSPNHAA